jgi:hypothetical protein
VIIHLVMKAVARRDEGLQIDSLMCSASSSAADPSESHAMMLDRESSFCLCARIPRADPHGGLHLPVFVHV